MKYSEQLKAARALIADKRHWTQGNFLRRHYVGRYIPWGYEYCATGALRAVREVGGGFARGDYTAEGRLAKVTHDLFGDSIIGVNDWWGHDAILECFNVAIEREEAFERGLSK